jgi:phosphoribosylamine--glycine ligase
LIEEEIDMKILVVGSGGREHAITWRLSKDAQNHELYVAPGNAGTAAIATNVNIKVDDIEGMVAWAKDENVDLVVVGPEAPLVKGLVDALTKEGIVAFGPVAAGAKIEGSKRFAKEIMSAAKVPTGHAESYTDPVKAKEALSRFGIPVVIKADGLAAGKGVVVAETLKDAEAAIDDMLVGNRFGAAGAEVLIEEFLEGEECSILAMTDGKTAVLLPSSQDHKRIFDGDKGPNTGGMGAYSPAPVVTDDMMPRIKDEIVMPVVRELAARGITYRGILYAGLMITPDTAEKKPLSGSNINVVEFNARFGDPETEAVLPRIEGDFSKALFNAATGNLSDDDIKVSSSAAATVVLSSAGYPGDYAKDKLVSGLENVDEKSVVFHCGTRFGEDGEVLTSGGRVFSVTGVGEDIRKAVDNAYNAVGNVSFEGMYFRKDIAHRAFNRGK